MRMHKKILPYISTLGIAAILSSSVLVAEEMNQSASKKFYSWDRFSTDLMAADDKQLERLPERLKGDDQVNQQLYQLILAAMARTSIDAIIGDREHPIFVPEINVALNIYQPNSDTIYKSALIEPGGVYRLRGTRGSVLFFMLGELGPDMIRTGKPAPAIAYHNFDTLKLDKDGRFDVILSAVRPDGYSGDWWQLDSKTQKLMLRQVSYNWAKEKDPSISIQRLDVEPGRKKMSSEDLSARLAELPNMIINASTFFVRHVEELREQGYINRLKVFDVQPMSGLTGQSYYEGAYDIRDDEALIVEVKIPKPCKYWSIILTNDIYQTTDWYNNQSSLNGAQAVVDNDGYFRAVVSARDPGVHNWLDTAGYMTGAIQGRWLECAGSPTPSVRKVKVTDVMKSLPASTVTVTAEVRETMIRDRVDAAQQRRLW